MSSILPLVLPHITPPLAVNRCRAGYFNSSAPVQRPRAKVPRKSPGSLRQPKPGRFLSRPHPFLYVYVQVKTAWARGKNIGAKPRNSRCRSQSECAGGRKTDLSEESRQDVTGRHHHFLQIAGQSAILVRTRLSGTAESVLDLHPQSNRLKTTHY